MKNSSRTRTAIRLMALLSPVLVAACLGGRGARRPPAAQPPVQQIPGRTDSSVTPVTVPPVSDSAAVANRLRDSLSRVSDSLTKLAADSTKKDSAKTPSKTPAKKPKKECDLEMGQLPDSRFTLMRMADSTSNLMVGGGFVGNCRGETNKIRADSAEYYETSGYVNLFGNVTYDEKDEFRVTSSQATYFLKEGKLFASGNVVATQLKSGSTFTGPNIEYFRVMPDIRTTSRLYAPNNPLVQIFQKDSTGKELPPIRISASVMQDNGDSVLIAWGNVNITRTDIVGRGDSASFDKPTSQARLIRAASIQSTSREQPFTLSADTIDMFTTDSVLDRVFAKHLGKAKSGEVTMSAERIDLRLVDRKIDRAYVYGAGRAKADTDKNSLEADSLDILIPNQRIKELRAFGTAAATSRPDTARMKSDENDVLKGDVIIAEFDSTRAPNDTTTKAQIRKVTANGHASSKVQIASRQGREFPPAINYIKGKHLVVNFDSGQVRDIAVDSSASGQYFEPIIDSIADTLKTRPVRPPRTDTLDAQFAALPKSPGLPQAPPASALHSYAILPSRLFRNR